MANNLQFPTGIGTTGTGQPWMLLTSYESKNAIESTGQTGHAGSNNYNPGIAKSSIALYIPPDALKTTFNSTWTETEGAARSAAFSGAAGRLYGGQEGVIDSMVAAMKSAGMTAVGAAAEQLDKGTGMLAAQGMAVNNHMALVYKGPTTMRTHEFAFKFFPKDQPEADAIQTILKDLENGMLPRMGGALGADTLIKGRTLSSPLFKAPRHWTIDFFMKGGGMRGEQETHGNKYLFKIKKSVITTMSVNHDPDSTVSFHKDGAPVHTNLSLTFKEIELPISDGG